LGVVLGVGVCCVLLEDEGVLLVCEDLDVVGVCGGLLKEDEEVDEESEAKRAGVDEVDGVDVLLCVDVLEDVVEVLEEDVLNFILFLGSGNVFHSSFHPSSPGCNLIH